MARGKYERKILDSHLDNFQEQLERSYSQYQEGSYVPITFYQLDRSKTQVDGSLEVAQNIIGASSSRKYKKIMDVPLYGMISGINYELEMTDSAFRNITSGQAYFIPGTITPMADDFFSIDRGSLKNHLFRISSLDYNTANPNKYYQFTYELYGKPSSDIINNVTEEYQFVIDNVGSNQNTIIKTRDVHVMEMAKEVVDILINKYVHAFYDFAHDTFTLRANWILDKDSTKLWNPYLLRFMHDQEILERYEYDIMTEIFIPQYFEGGYWHWFKDDVWMDSLYNKIVTKQKIEQIDLYTTVTRPDNLNKWIKLPFYQANGTILLDSFANTYTKNYIKILDSKQIDAAPENTRALFFNLKSIFSNNVEPDFGKDVRYINEKYLLELEYFSINGDKVLEDSVLGDRYYVYNNNSGHIDNVYEVTGTPGEVGPGSDESLQEKNKYFKLLDTFKEDIPIGTYLMFYDEDVNISSSWSLRSDKHNRFIGREDGSMFTSGSIQIGSDLVSVIRDYIGGSKTVSVEMLEALSNLTIRRDSAEAFYLLPLVIFVLKQYINNIQR